MCVCYLKIVWKRTEPVLCMYIISVRNVDEVNLLRFTIQRLSWWNVLLRITGNHLRMKIVKKKKKRNTKCTGVVTETILPWIINWSEMPSQITHTSIWRMVDDLFALNREYFAFSSAKKNWCWICTLCTNCTIDCCCRDAHEKFIQ